MPGHNSDPGTCWISVTGTDWADQIDMPKWSTPQLDVKSCRETGLVEVEYAFVDTAPVRLLEFNLTDQAVDM